jgi:preprotein translocase subunit SecG
LLMIQNVAPPKTAKSSTMIAICFVFILCIVGRSLLQCKKNRNLHKHVSGGRRQGFKNGKNTTESIGLHRTT